MNTALSSNSFPLPSSPPLAGRRTNNLADPLDAASRDEGRYARRVVSRLDQSSSELPHDVSERLRFARNLALQKARMARVAEAAASVSVHGSGTAALSAGGSGRQATDGRQNRKRWWLRVAAVVPLLTLVGGLVVIQHLHASAQIKAAADIDAQLLADDLPPAAYADPAFAEFLRAPRD